MSAELIQSVMEIVDSAHTQQFQLTDRLQCLRELQEQVKTSALQSKDQLQNHFASLKNALCQALDQRLAVLLERIDEIENTALVPLLECEVMIQEELSNAHKVLDEGKSIFKDGPENNLEKIIKLKDSPLMKSLSSLPEIPLRSEVACIMVDTSNSCLERIVSLVQHESRVISRAPVQITDVLERPGSLLVKWAEIEEEEAEILEYCLQYSYGSIKSNNDTNASFHTAYTGPDTSFIVKHLRTDTQYSFRLCGRSDSSCPWSVWTIPVVAATSIPHFQWSSCTTGYSTSNENKTATRTNEGLTTVLYSNLPSLDPGQQVHFRILDAGERAPGDGIGLTAWVDNSDTLIRQGAIFVDTNGVVYVDGQEMKMKLPALGKGTCITFGTEPLPNGKIRVSVQVKDKEVTSDWKMESTRDFSDFGVSTMAFNFQRQMSSQQFYFALRFTHEDWKVGVE